MKCEDRHKSEFVQWSLYIQTVLFVILCIHICITDERLMSAVIISMAGDEIMPVEDWLAIITPLWDHYTHLLVPSHQSQNYSNYRCRDFNRHSKSDRLLCSLLPASGISQGPNKYDCDIWCLSLCVYPAPPGLAALAVLWRITRSVSCWMVVELLEVCEVTISGLSPQLGVTLHPHPGHHR